MAFKDIIGHTKAITILRRTLDRNRLPSAYLFAGESGTGKKFVAINLAKAINCLKPKDREQASEHADQNSEFADACEECSSCIKIVAGTHPDLLFIAPDKSIIRIAEVRAVEETLSLRPYEGIKKIVIIDEADAMNQEAANAFLKTLEEPPGDSLVILITANPDRLPETIRSRTCRINFAPLSPEACEKVIRNQRPGNGSKEVRAETGKTEASQISNLVRLSMGRPGLALSSDLLKERKYFIDLLREMVSGNTGAWAGRAEMEQWLDMACLLMRDMAVLKITGDEGLLFNADLKDNISAKDKTGDIKDILQAFDKLTRLKEIVGFNLNAKITWNYIASYVKGAMNKVSAL